TFANNDGWHDDTSDGPVSARVVLKGSTSELPVEPAWVVTAPPNYAPDIIGFVTLYDLLQDVAAQRWLPLPEKPSFTEHIYPLLARLVETQWVNKGFLAQYGWKSPMDLLEPTYLARLSRPPDTSADGQGADPYKEDRVNLFNAFRSPAFKMMDRLAIPAIYGDGMERTPENPRQWLSVTATQYKWLKQWAAGDFLQGSALKPPPPLFEEVPLEKRPETLDKAALHYCLGGPFHPGCEVTWPMRHATLYSEPFRVRVRSPREPEPEYGPTLAPAVALDTNGPLYAQGPGDLTRWMAVPWQSDTSSCLSGYDPTYDEYLPTFWPARVPNQVLTEQSYQVVMDESRPLEERQQAFMERPNWLRIFRQEYLMLINQFVTGFDKVGVVERKPGPADGAFPEVLYVETGVETGEQPAAEKAMLAMAPRAERPRPAEKWRPRGLELVDKAHSRRRGGR
ncbi:MAG TPA: LodA/GoxA family CTQ-dependent oxidase, partial [Archangium sp.]|nr:LodA/GoxA family CTQ-dependent oxidase [Archangium sp.]